MSDIATTADKAGKKRPEGWTPSEDGASVSKTYKFTAPAAAVKLARRALQLAQKSHHALRLDYSARSVTVGLVAAGGMLADGERRLARRLDGLQAAAKPAKAAKPRAKTAKASAAPAAASDKPAAKAKAPRTAKTRSAKASTAKSKA